jgi:hypothetical protein
MGDTASTTLLHLLSAQRGDGPRLLDTLRDWHQRPTEGESRPHSVLVLAERRRPDGFVVLSDWPAATEPEEIEAASLDLSLAIADLLVFEPAIYRLRPLRADGADSPPSRGACAYVGASLTFAPEALAATVEQMAVSEGERLSGRPGFAWTRRLHSIAGPSVVFTCSGWASHADFERALEAVMEPVEDRIDLLGCKQVFFSLTPTYEGSRQ